MAPDKPASLTFEQLRENRLAIARKRKEIRDHNFARRKAVEKARFEAAQGEVVISLIGYKYGGKVPVYAKTRVGGWPYDIQNRKQRRQSVRPRGFGSRIVFFDAYNDRTHDPEFAVLAVHPTKGKRNIEDFREAK